MIWHDFVILPENRHAYRAVKLLSKSASENRRVANPFIFLHGQTGSGKSHLVRMIQRELGESVWICPAKDFTRPMEFVDALKSRVLVLEDIQFVNFEQAEKIVSVFDARLSRRQFLIVTSNSPPSGLSHLPVRLTSRISSGLVVHLGPLSQESKDAFLPLLLQSKKNKASGSDKSVNADHAKSDSKESRDLKDSKESRDLKDSKGSKRSRESKGSKSIFTSGSIRRVIAVQNQEFMNDQKQLFDHILKRVSQTFKIPVETLLNEKNTRKYSTARQVVSILATEEYRMRQSTVNRMFTITNMSTAGSAIALKCVKDEKLGLVLKKLREECRAEIKKLVAQVAREDDSSSTKVDKKKRVEKSKTKAQR